MLKEETTSESRGRITLTARSLAGQAEIRISDTGIGISEAIGRNLFNLLFTTEEPGEGIAFIARLPSNGSRSSRSTAVNHLE